MLLVDDRQPEPGQRDLFLEQRVRTDREVSLATLNRRERALSLLRRQAAGKPRDLHGETFEPYRELAVMLLGENFGRRHERYLTARLDRLQRSQRGNDRLAASHVALKQALHRLRTREIAPDLGAYTLLRTREREWQTRKQRSRER